ncbi:lipoprotein, putative [Aliivibrio fischeri ES114]|uniref:Lipoprotein, putative n=1 Tax=Aliivibrio fischeri (strain ATCC 700601 / ES114) TaxID=312309 RepID=Q5DZK9_ALIF1|nr:lipoprotein [Aliivibrio fischeri]AAW87787.1 lipoprotein, putative [Aliivibrio fischeri ES114]KLU80276.1 hypothetical protein AB192_00165 [Aliivibrio fischeri]
MALNKTFLIACTVILLYGCNQDESSTPNAVVEPPKTDVELLNEQEWDDNRVYVTKDNYILMKEANGTIPGIMKPCFVVNSAKEWPREDLSNADSYDLPRVDFRWNNGDFVSASASEKAIYESYDKVWSIKTDGTDLRLVTDDFSGDVRIMRRSPNNRYLAYSYASRTSGGTDKVVFDVQTQKSTLLGTDLGHSQFLWAEDSSYLYFEDRAIYWKYELATGKTTQMDDDFYFSEVGVIYGGKRYVVSDYGIVVFNESNNKRLYSIGLSTAEEDKLAVKNISLSYDRKYFLKSRSISPDGKYAWGESAQYRYFINTETKEVKLEKKDRKKKSQYRFFDVLGFNAEYVRSASAGSARQYKLTKDKKLFSQTLHWGQICSGHSATLSWLYNGFANNGAFVKEDK